MRGFLLVYAVIFLSFLPSDVGAQSKIDFDFGDEGSVVTGGRSSGPGREDGNCAGCSTEEGPIGISNVPVSPSEPVAPTSGQVSGYSYDDIRVLTRSRDNDGDPRWGRVSGIDAGGVTGDRIVSFDRYIRSFFSDIVFIPASIIREATDKQKLFESFVAKKVAVPVIERTPFPVLPTHDQIYTTVSEIFDKTFTDPRLKDRDNHKIFNTELAKKTLMSTYKVEFDKVKMLIDQSNDRVLSLLSGRIEVISAYKDEVEKINSDGSAQIGVTMLRLNRAVGSRVSAYALDEINISRSDVSSAPYLHEPLLASGLITISQVTPTISGRPKSPELKEVYRNIQRTIPSSYQGYLAKKIASFLAELSAKNESSLSWEDRKLAAKGREDAMSVLSIATGLLPIVGTARDLYEAYSGEDLFTGSKLTDRERALRIAFVSVGVSTRVVSASDAMQRTVDDIKRYSSGEIKPSSKLATDDLSITLDQAGIGWVDAVDKLRSASNQWVNYRKNVSTPNGYDFSMGTATRDQSRALGLAWVGEGASRIDYKGGILYISRDGLTQYRSPILKDSGKIQANFQKRLKNSGVWLSNGHLDILD